jgi:hypothetical protein
MGVEFLHGVKNFHQGKDIFEQDACNFLACCKNSFYSGLARIVVRYLYKQFFLTELRH